jgi:tetratricopeptide (TPR) repeat protein
MSSPNHLPATEKYLFSRDGFRSCAKREFFESKSGVAPLISAINDYVASTILELSGQDMRPIPNSRYIGGLIVSFVRTHFIILDLVTCSELIEAATLLRKQFELLARLNELYASETIDHLLKKTPNLSALKTHIRRLYGGYSEIAHSATLQPLELLGHIDDGKRERTAVYPVFLEDAYVTLQHVVLSVFEYYLWAHKFLSENFQNYDRNWGMEWLLDAIEKHDVTYGSDLKQLVHGGSTPTPPQDASVVQQTIEETTRQPAPTNQELSAEAYFHRGLALHDNSDEEIAYYSEAIRLDPRCVEAYSNRGVARRARGDLAGAIADYTEAIRCYPRHASIYRNRGNAHEARGDLAGAIADYTEAIRRYPRHASIYRNRGNAHEARGDLAGAIADYTEAIRLNPQYAEAYSNRGVARGMQGDLAGAITDCTEAIRLDPRCVEAYSNRGVARGAQGDQTGAIADYMEAIRFNPQYAEAYYNRGVAHGAQGDQTGAITDYTEAIRLNPQYTNAYYNRGLARRAQGDLAGAIADYEQYLTLGGGKRDGDQEEVEQRIRALRAQLVAPYTR